MEFGGGPNIFPLISVTPHVSEIVFSEYVEDNLKEVVLWKNKDPKAYDWSDRFQHVVGELEGNSDPKIPVQRKEELRSKIKAIIRCDARADDVLGGATSGPFDIISTNLCIGAVAQSLDEYRGMLCKINKLLKPGGYLIDMVAEECDGYPVGEHNFYYLYMKKEEILSSVTSAGFTVRHTALKKVQVGDRPQASNIKGLFFVVSQKN